MPQEVTTSTTIEQRIPDCDIPVHLDDEIVVNAIRNGQIIQVYWNELTESERREAYNATFSPYSIY